MHKDIPVHAEDIESLISLSSPTLSPDGAVAVFAASHPSLAADRQVGQLWRVSVDGGVGLRRITRGVDDRKPLFSPDGTMIAFLRLVGRVHQLAVVSADGGEPLVVTDQALGVEDFLWAADGQRLVFSSRSPEQGRYGTEPGVDAAHEQPRHLHSLNWTSNGMGNAFDRPLHLWSVAVQDPDSEPVYPVFPSGKNPAVPSVVELTPERETTVAGFGWGGDGRLLAILHPAEFALDLRTSVVACADSEGRLLEDGVVEVVPASEGFAFQGVGALHGQTVLWGVNMDASHRDFVGKTPKLYTTTDGGIRWVKTPESIEFAPLPHVVVDDRGILTTSQRHGRILLLRVSLDGTVSTLVDGDIEVSGADVSGDAFVYTAATPDTFSDLFDASGHALTDFGDSLRKTGLVKTVEHEFPTRDGETVHGWAAIPEGEGPFPVILNIHGGPHGMFGIHPFDETQVMASAGYAVVYCNPRGSAGYGFEAARTIRGRLGTVDYTDVMDFLDGVLAAHPEFDSSRVGIMGGSYGGYMTAWTIAHEHRFLGAIVERGMLDPLSMMATSDIGPYFNLEYTGDDPEQVKAQSPMAFVDEVTTPTLVIHSEQDIRCPLEQGLRYFKALKRNGVETEMLLFPGENHELTRSGQPRHRVERFETVLEWWSRHLA